ncbi:hypothetical protein OIO90_001915 [Microbotryomycetes sp. JL221]|nr:hypothetical protein OIO90_001915 [Microbotryomycetes sp. JL221]
MTAADNEDAIAQLTKMLGSTWRVTITTGRTFIGQFACLDKQGNLVLENTTEYYDQLVDDNMESWSAFNEFQHQGRHVGMVLIPYRHCKTIEKQVETQHTNFHNDVDQQQASSCAQS